MNLEIILQNQYVLIGLGIWELTWRGLGLWRAAKNNQKIWFIPLLVINSIGLLPIIYLSIDWYKNKDVRKITVFSKIKNLFTKK